MNPYRQANWRLYGSGNTKQNSQTPGETEADKTFSYDRGEWYHDLLRCIFLTNHTQNQKSKKYIHANLNIGTRPHGSDWPTMDIFGTSAFFPRAQALSQNIVPNIITIILKPSKM